MRTLSTWWSFPVPSLEWPTSASLSGEPSISLARSSIRLGSRCKERSPFQNFLAILNSSVRTRSILSRRIARPWSRRCRKGYWWKLRQLRGEAYRRIEICLTLQERLRRLGRFRRSKGRNLRNQQGRYRRRQRWQSNRFSKMNYLILPSQRSKNQRRVRSREGSNSSKARNCSHKKSFKTVALNFAKRTVSTRFPSMSTLAVLKPNNPYRTPQPPSRSST